MRKTIDEIQTQLGLLESIYSEVITFKAWFHRIQSLFNQDTLPWQERQRQIDEVFQEIYNNILTRQPTFKLETVNRFFLESRLWLSWGNGVVYGLLIFLAYLNMNSFQGHFAQMARMKLRLAKRNNC